MSPLILFMDDQTYLQILHLLSVARIEVGEAQRISSEAPEHIRYKLAFCYNTLSSVATVISDARLSQVLDVPLSEVMRKN